MSVNEWLELNKSKQIKKSPSEKSIQLKASQEDELKRYGIEKNEFNIVRKMSSELKKSNNEIDHWTPDKLRTTSEPIIPIRRLSKIHNAILLSSKDDNESNKYDNVSNKDDKPNKDD